MGSGTSQTSLEIGSSLPLLANFRSPFSEMTMEEVDQIKSWEIRTHAFPKSATEGQIQRVFGRVQNLMREDFASGLTALYEEHRTSVEERFSGYTILPPGEKMKDQILSKEIEWGEAVTMEWTLGNLEWYGGGVISIAGDAEFKSSMIRALTRLAVTRVGRGILIGAEASGAKLTISESPPESQATSSSFHTSRSKPQEFAIVFCKSSATMVYKDRMGLRFRYTTEEESLEDQASTLGHELLHFLHTQTSFGDKNLNTLLKEIPLCSFNHLLHHYKNLAEFFTIEGHLFGYPSESILNLELGLSERYGHCAILPSLDPAPFSLFEKMVLESIQYKIHKDVFPFALRLLQWHQGGVLCDESAPLLLLSLLMESAVWLEALEYEKNQDDARMFLDHERLEDAFLYALSSSNVTQRRALLERMFQKLLPSPLLSEYTSVLERIKVEIPLSAPPSSPLSPTPPSSPETSMQELVVVSAQSSPSQPGRKSQKRRSENCAQRSGQKFSKSGT